MTIARTIMVQGTASSVGKSILVTALCRILRQDGYRVAPFKAQNMSLNSFVTTEGGEIGRAQAVQAEAACIAPSVYMNPILLKPEGDAKSQVIVSGKVWKTLEAGQYWRNRQPLLEVVQKSLDRLRTDYDVVVIEGAGSPAEINLKDQDIVNMRVAMMAGAPVLLVGDVDRGGVFAALVGTLHLLTPRERGYVKGLIVNRFRGDVSLLRPGVDKLEKMTGKPCLGVVPYLPRLGIAQEDSVYLDDRQRRKGRPDCLDIAVIWLPHISNYDDFDPLDRDDCAVRYVSAADDLGVPDVIIVPGTKTTISDLLYIRSSGLAQAIVERHRMGVAVIGICGGYQILGKTISDPGCVESGLREVEGLSLLDVETTFGPAKRTSQVRARVEIGHGLLGGLEGQELEGYEIHMGSTTKNSGACAFRIVHTPGGETDYEDGCVDSSGRVMGTYIHGLFNNENFTTGLLSALGRSKTATARRDTRAWRDQEYDRLALAVKQSLDMKQVYEILATGMESTS